MHFLKLSYKFTKLHINSALSRDFSEKMAFLQVGVSFSFSCEQHFLRACKLFKENKHVKLYNKYQGAVYICLLQDWSNMQTFKEHWLPCCTCNLHTLRFYKIIKTLNALIFLVVNSIILVEEVQLLWQGNSEGHREWPGLWQIKGTHSPN